MCLALPAPHSWTAWRLCKMFTRCLHDVSLLPWVYPKLIKNLPKSKTSHLVLIKGNGKSFLVYKQLGLRSRNDWGRLIWAMAKSPWGQRLPGAAESTWDQSRQAHPQEEKARRWANLQTFLPKLVSTEAILKWEHLVSLESQLYLMMFCWSNL